MTDQITRKEFLSKCFKVCATAVTLSACGNLTPFAYAADNKEIEVDESGLITSVSDLKEKKAVHFVYKGKKSVLLYNDGEYRAFENICTHKGGPSKVVKGKLVCKWHGAKFDPLTGQALTRPAPVNSKLPAVGIKVTGNNIYIIQ